MRAASSYRFRWLSCCGLLGGFAVVAGCRSGPLPPPHANRSVDVIPAISAAPSSGAEADGTVQLTRFVESFIWPARPKWRSWGEQNLRSGDLVFIRSNYRILLGTFNLSQFLAEVADSPFSHVGMVVIEESGPMIYDASDKGVTAQAFEKFITDGQIQRVAVRRLRPEHQHAIPAAVAFVQKHQQRKTRFDDRFESGDEKLYCTELIVEAFREGGVSLSEPTPVRELPGLGNVTPMVLQMAKWATHLSEEDLVWLPGNQDQGLFGSPSLTTVLEPD